MIKRVGILVAAIVVLAAVAVWLLLMRGPRRIPNVYHQRGIITIVAGSGHRGYSGDGGLATKASLSAPQGLDLGKDGSLYIADSGNNRIRKVNPNGIITTIAGDGWKVKKKGRWQGRFTGDGGPATKASLSVPEGVAVGPDGSLYVADTGNGRIRKVDPKGVLRTVVNSTRGAIAHDLRHPFPPLGPMGDRWHFKDNNQPANKACLSQPVAVTEDQHGNLLIADNGLLRVCKVDRKGMFTCVPTGGVIERGGAILVMRRAGDGGPARRAQFGDVSDVAAAPDGSLFVSDMYTQVVRKINPKGIITTFAGNGWCNRYRVKEGEHIEGMYNGDDILAGSASLNWPSGVAVAVDSSVYIADMCNHRVRRVDRKGIITTVVGDGRIGRPQNGQVSTSARLGFPARLAVDVQGDLYISDSVRSQVYKVTWLRPKGNSRKSKVESRK